MSAAAGAGPAAPSIRTMTDDDVAAVLALEERLFPHDAWPESFFREELAEVASGTRQYWVAVDDDGTVLGYAGLMCVLPIADVQTLAVAPEAQGRGLGTRLLRLLVETAVARRADQVLLEVRADNPGAQALYAREGFAAIHTRPRYYPDGEDALIMQKPLRDLDAPTSASRLRS